MYFFSLNDIDFMIFLELLIASSYLLATSNSFFNGLIHFYEIKYIMGIQHRFYMLLLKLIDF
jgi:hypothetical protein